MVSHAPPGYRCPFCALAQGIPDVAITSPTEIVWEDAATLAFVGAVGFGRRPGHCLVIPREHFENLYAVPDELAGAMHATIRRVARAYRFALGAEGTSIRQHNEPAGNQDVWHYHVHVFPRYLGDDLYVSPGVRLALPDRLSHAERLREALLRA